MRYIVDLPSAIVKEMSELISQGKYESPQQFIITALQNQVYVEKSQIELEFPTAPIEEEGAHERLPRTIDEQLVTNTDSVPVVKPPERSLLARGYLLGLYNRFFPIKITLRVLANTVKENDAYISLEKVQVQATDVARNLGLMLRRKDRQYERVRGKKLSSALPIGRNDFKAKARFRSHFVGFMTKNGQLDGLPVALGFVNLTKDEKGVVRIGLTDRGLAFSKMNNPILDDQAFKRTLSEDECAFLTDLILNELPEEAHAVKMFLERVSSDPATVTQLDSAISTLNANWSPVLVGTQRSGLIARLTELGLIERLIKGKEVRYTVSEKGRLVVAKFLHEVKPVMG